MVREMAQCLRTLSVLEEDQVSFLALVGWLTTACTSSLRVLCPLLASEGNCPHTDMHALLKDKNRTIVPRGFLANCHPLKRKGKNKVIFASILAYSL